MDRRTKSCITILVFISSILTSVVQFISEAGALPSPAHWDYAGFSGGGAFPSMAYDPNTPGRVYLVSDVAGVYSSPDRGDSWVRKNQGLPNINCSFVAVSALNPSIIYAGTASGISKTTDGGTTWTPLPGTSSLFQYNRPNNYKSIAIDRLDPNKVYAGTHTGEVYFTADGGQTWARLGSTVYPFGQTTSISAAYLTRDSSSLFVGSPLGLRRYDLSSGVWTTLNTGTMAVTDIVGYGFTETVYITYGNKVAWSLDNGQTWQLSSAVPLSIGGSVFRIAVMTGSSGNTKLLASCKNSGSGAVFLSDNAGASWSRIGNNTKNFNVSANPTRAWWPEFAYMAFSVNFDPFLPDTIYMSDYWGVWRSDDNGLNWYEKIRDLPNTVGTALDVTSDGDILAGMMDDGLLRSSDNGATYQSLAPNAGFKGNNINGHVWRVKAIGSNKIIATNTPWDTNYKNQILVSEDAGATFSIITSGLPTTRPSVNTNWGTGYPKALAVDPINPLKMYLGIDGDDGGGFFYSIDGGYHWTQSAGQPASKRVFNGLAVDPIEPNRIYWGTTGTGSGVYRSENSGLSWSHVFNSSVWVYDIAVAKDQTVYAAASSSGPVLYVSRDRGASWSLLKRFAGTSGSCLAVTPDPNNALRIAVSATMWSHKTGGKIYMTEDGGITWTEITGDFPYSDGLGAMAFSPDGQTLYASAMAGSVYKLSLATPDTTAPSAPANLTAALNGTTTNLSWAASTDNMGVAGYQIFRNNLPLSTSTAAAYNDATAAAGTTYSYSVKAFDAANNLSSPSNTVTLTVGPLPDTAAPTAPTGLTAALSGTTANLSWAASTDNVGVTGYTVYSGATALGTTTSLSYAHVDLQAGATYVYTVKSSDAAGNFSAASSSTTVTMPVPDTTSPTAPAIFQFSLISGAVTLSWEASTDNVAISGYSVYRGGFKIGSTQTTNFSDNTIIDGSTYIYTAKAEDAAGNVSAASNAVTVAVPDTTVPAAPSDLTAILSGGGTQANLAWTAAADNVGVTGYKVYRNNAFLAQSSLSSYSDPTVAGGTTYTYSVEALDAAGNVSARSNTASVTTPTPVNKPVFISTQVSSVTSTTAVTDWLLDVPATAHVRYGTSVSSMTSTTDTVASNTSGAVILNNLSKGTKYYLQVVAMNSAGTTWSDVKTIRTKSR